ncbi:hypothetical protein ScPMuIL_009758 [Solemya velum]
MVRSKAWILETPFHGIPKEDDFKLLKEDLNDLKDGEVLCEALYLSVDPYMRSLVSLGMLKAGSPMVGDQVAIITESKSRDYPVGTNVIGRLGWRSHTIVSDLTHIKLLPPMDDLPLSLALGPMGMTGMTAYFGLLEILDPKPGETVLVNSGAGAVGSIVGQIAKIKGCRVVACAGSEDKCKWIKEDLGFDVVFNYKTVDLGEALSEAAPDGIECFFDNVAGDFMSTVFPHMKLYGRIACCGTMSTYNAVGPQPSGPHPYMTIVFKQLRLEGFMVRRWWGKWSPAQVEMLQWIKEGKIKYKECLFHGIETMPKGFISLFEGSNFGKVIIKA